MPGHGDSPDFARLLQEAIGPLRARIAAHPEGARAFVLLGTLEDLLWDPSTDPVTVWEGFARLQAALPFSADDPAVSRLVALLPVIPT